MKTLSEVPRPCRRREFAIGLVKTNMDAWRDIRLKARECRAAALKHTGGQISADAVIKGALKADDLQLRRYAPGTGVSANVLGYLQRDAGIVNIATGQSPTDEAVVIAHEIG